MTVEFSPALLTDQRKNIIFPTANAVTINVSSVNLYPLLPKNYDLNGVGEITGYIKIMSGTAPNDFTTLTKTTDYSANVLVTYTINDTDVFGTFTDVVSNPVEIKTTYQTANANGTASWFWWVVTEPEANSNIVGHQIVGTIGVSGSNSDLEMANTTIETGKYYRISNFLFIFPSTY